MKNPFVKIRLFWQELIAELKKVAWPTKKELKNSTFVVIIAIAILGTYITIVDFSLFQVVNLFTSWVKPGLNVGG